MRQGSARRPPCRAEKCRTRSLRSYHALRSRHGQLAPAVTAEILALRPALAKRAAPGTLRRALVESGRPYRCEACDGGDTWQGRSLTLQVDHFDGRYGDCRPENLQFLCPNWHSQTAAHAGRNRPRQRVPLVRVDALGNPAGDAEPPQAVTEADRIDLLRRVDRGEVTVTDAARRFGCHRNHVHALRRRLRERGSLAPAERRPASRVEVRGAVVEFAARHPSLGAKALATALAGQLDPIRISHGTIAAILKDAGLNTRAARLATAGLNLRTAGTT